MAAQGILANYAKSFDEVNSGALQQACKITF
jgi:hypothetical protein